MKSVRLIGLILGLVIVLTVAVWQSGGGQTGQVWSSVDADFVVGGADCYGFTVLRCPGDKNSCSSTGCNSVNGEIVCKETSHEQSTRPGTFNKLDGYYGVETKTDGPGWLSGGTQVMHCTMKYTCKTNCLPNMRATWHCVNSILFDRLINQRDEYVKGEPCGD